MKKTTCYLLASFAVWLSPLAVLALAMSPADAVRAALADAKQQPDGVRNQTRYLQMVAADDKDLATEAKAISYLLNSVSRSRAIAIPRRCGPEGRLVCVDLASYADFKRPSTYQEMFKAWEQLAELDPYFHLRTQVLAAGEKAPKTVTTDGGWTDVQAAAELKKLSGSFGAILRSDYFAAHVAGDRYDDWAGVPAKEADFFKLFGVDVSTIGELAADSAANQIRSAVTRKPRRIIWRPGAFGGVWQTKDVDAESPDRDPLRNPVDIATQKFNFQASELFALGANRLWRVAIFDGAGNRVAAVPDKVAKDYTGDGIIRNMLTCVRCHELNGGIGGLQPFHDDQTDLIATAGANSYLPEVVQRIHEVYDNVQLGTALTRDREDFAAAVGRCTGGMSPKEAITALAALYGGYLDAQVSPAIAAAEVGLELPQLQGVLGKSRDPYVLAIAAGKSVNRVAWESSFADAALLAEQWRAAQAKGGRPKELGKGQGNVLDGQDT